MTTDSDPPDSDDFDHEEKTDHGVEDVPKPMRSWARTTSRRMRTVEKQFEKGGMVRDLHEDWNAVKKGAGFFKWFAPMVGGFVVVVVGALVTGIIYLVNHAATQPPPQPAPRAEDIAREVLKQQQK